MRTIHTVAIATATFAGGVAAGYFIAQKRLTSEFDRVLAEQNAVAKEYYKLLYKTEEYSTPEKAAAALNVAFPEELEIVIPGEPAILPEDRQRAEEIVDEEEYNVGNVFEQEGAKDPGPDPDEPVRNAEYPYVISEGEWMLQERGFEQAQLTYYEGDNTLADDLDSMIPDIDGTIGDRNLNEFGKEHAPTPDVLFIRNEKLEMEFEIVKDPGTFSERVLGIPDEMLEPRSPKRKRRDERDD